MAAMYLLFVFEKDDKSMRQIGDPRRIGILEAIDNVNGEYVFWDSNGNGVLVAASVNTFRSKIGDATSCAPLFPLRDAFSLSAKTLGLADFDVAGLPNEVWRRIQEELKRRP
jgi:hypothetical protein